MEATLAAGAKDDERFPSASFSAKEPVALARPSPMGPGEENPCKVFPFLAEHHVVIRRGSFLREPTGPRVSTDGEFPSARAKTNSSQTRPSGVFSPSDHRNGYTRVITPAEFFPATSAE